jgi:DNA-binding transcriptional regulator YiaG
MSKATSFLAPAWNLEANALLSPPMSSSKESGQPAGAPRRRGRPKSNTLAPSPLVARLIAHRESQGWTQPETARRLGISVNTLKGYECGNRIPNGPNTLKILELLNGKSSIQS